MSGTAAEMQRALQRAPACIVTKIELIAAIDTTASAIAYRANQSVLTMQTIAATIVTGISTTGTWTNSGWAGRPP